MDQVPSSDTNGSMISIVTSDPSHSSSAYSSPTIIDAPEKKLTNLAFRLAVLQTAATRLGTICFIWATVVLLGGFAVTLENIDFWFVTVILLIEGVRIFGRSHELEWQRHATWSIADAGVRSFRILKATSRLVVNSARSLARVPSNGGVRGSGDAPKARNRPWYNPILPTYTNNTRTTNVDVLRHPDAPWGFVSRNTAKLLNWIQLFSAVACTVLSVMRLVKHNYGNVQKDTKNRGSALVLFYSLAFAEALLFVVEWVYFEWKVHYCKLLENVKEECDLKVEGTISIRRFFYDAYSRSVNGSIFDGLKMDMVSFGMDLLRSNSPDEQRIGAEILRQFAKSKTKQFSDETLQKIGINISVIERLVEILNWKSPGQEEIRRSAAEILVEVASKKQNSLRVAGVPGTMESISSLLYIDRSSSGASYRISEKNISDDTANYEYLTFSGLGIHLLKKLARDHDNCGKIGNTRGLLPKIIDFTEPGERFLKENVDTSSHMRIIKRSLKLVKLLASTTGTSGTLLRKEISKIVFTVSNIRKILRHGAKYPRIQELGIQILTSLALEVEAREMIGGAGGVLEELLSMFLKKESSEFPKEVRIASGEALAMLTLESAGNCHRMVKLEEMKMLKETLKDPSVRKNAARILWNLLTFTEDVCFSQLQGITSAAAVVLEGAVQSDDIELQEVMVGLEVHVFRFMTSKEISGYNKVELAKPLVQILKTNPYPPINVPGIRRFAIELAIWMMRREAANVQVFRDLGMEDVLQSVAKTTAEIENFYVFSGTVGVSKHKITINSLVETALQLLLDKFPKCGIKKARRTQLARRAS